ncbi:MAG: hypothetical protein FWC79_04300 [Oscillospiraceae bacterium]|nr:hypothetical protein [Oscillospiraceae bacterium]
MDGHIASGHEYVKKSLRIIRVMGRQENNAWWGKDAFRVLVDNNFLVSEPDEPIDRYLKDLYFKGYRGLTIDEFLTQMHSEGQLLDKQTADDILKFDYVRNGDTPFTPDPDDDTKVAHFSLELGDLHFNDTNTTIDLINNENNTIFPNIPTKNLPYAYWIYYDTRATEAILDNGFFYYFNAVSFIHDEGKHDIGSTDLWIKLEDASGGSGHITEVRIRKVDTENEPIRDIKFILTQTNVFPHRVREAMTTINGTCSFTLGLGDYILEEEVPLGSNIIPVAPMHFTITDYNELVNLRALLEGTGYPNIDDIRFEQGVNVITNHEKTGICVILNANKTAIGKELEDGMFEFAVMDGEVIISKTTNKARE